MKPPPIPPDRAFASGGVVDAETRSALAEARRIRDTWVAAVEAARDAAREEAVEELHAQLSAVNTLRAALAAASSSTARRQAVELAERLVGATLATAPERVTAWLAALIEPTPATWLRVRVPPGLPLPELPDGMEVVVDEALSVGDLILEGINGVVDARIATRLARLVE